MKKSGTLRHYQVQRHRRRPGTLAVYHDTVAVASERPNILLDPFEHHRLVVDAEESGGVIARARAKSRRRQEPEDACSVGRRYEHDILPAHVLRLFVGVVFPVVRRAPFECSGWKVHDDWELGARAGAALRSVHVEVQLHRRRFWVVRRPEWRNSSDVRGVSVRSLR